MEEKNVVSILGDLYQISVLLDRDSKAIEFLYVRELLKGELHDNE